MLELLPDEVAFEIFVLVGYKCALQSLSRASQRLKSLTLHSDLWQLLWERHGLSRIAAMDAKQRASVGLSEECWASSTGNSPTTRGGGEMLSKFVACERSRLACLRRVRQAVGEDAECLPLDR